MFENVGVLITMAFVGERVLELLQPVVKPGVVWLESKLKTPEGWLMRVTSLIVVGLIVAATEANAFPNLVPNEVFGRIITVIVGAGGSNYVHNTLAEKSSPTE